MSVIVEFSPTHHKAVVYDKRLSFLIDADQKGKRGIQKEFHPESYRMHTDPLYQRKEIEDKFPYPFIRNRLVTLVEHNKVLQLLFLALNKQMSVNDRKRWARSLNAYCKIEYIQCVQEVFSKKSLPKDIQVRADVVALMPKVFRRIVKEFDTKRQQVTPV